MGPWGKKLPGPLERSPPLFGTKPRVVPENFSNRISQKKFGGGSDKVIPTVILNPKGVWGHVVGPKFGRSWAKS